MISTATIQTIRELPLDTSIGRYVTGLTKSTGGTWKGKSPWNDEKTPSFYIHSAKGFWKDFSSGKGGRDVISFLMQKENLDFVEAVTLAAQDNKITLEFDDSDATKQYYEALEKRKSLMPIIEWAFTEFKQEEIPEAFLKRFNKVTCHQFNVGFCAASLIDEAKKTGIDLGLLVQAGLIGSSSAEERVRHYEKFLSRIIFPSYDPRGQVIGFTGRVNGTPRPNEPKYLHSAFEKSKTLFGLQLAGEAMREAESAYVVEGPTDCMRFHEYKQCNTVAMQGSDLSEEQCTLIKRYCSNITIVADNDVPGLKALNRNAEIAIKNGLNVKVLIPGKKK